MKYFTLLIFSILVQISCKRKKNLVINKTNKDSLIYYYNESTNKELSYHHRLIKINKAYKHIDKTKIDSSTLAVILRKVQIHSDLDQHQKLNHFNNLLNFYSQNTNSNYFKAKSHYISSYYNEFIVKQKDSAFYHMTKAKEYFSQLHDSSNVGKRSLDLAYMQYESINYHESINSCTEALKFLSQENDSKYIASAYDLIARNYSKLDLFEKASKNHKKAISIATSKRSLLIYLNNFANLYIKKKEFHKAITIYNSIDQNGTKKIQDKALIIDNLAYAKWLQNPKLNIENELNKAFQIRKQENNTKGLIDSYEHLAHYFSNKNPKKAINYANQLTKASRLAVHPNGELKALKIMMNIHPKDTQSRNRYIHLKDSLDLAHSKVRNQYAKIKYDNKQALEENETLKQKNNYEQLLKTRYALLAVIAFLILTFYIYHTFQKRKQVRQRYEQEKLQAVYKTETGISKKIHDEVANGIFQVMAQVENENTPNSQNYIDKLDHIYKKTRDISHQISEIDLGSGYIMELQGMLEDYQTNTVSILINGIKTIYWNKINPIKKETIFRVLNELMVNMKKHSHAEVVQINFNLKKEKLYISYSDDGQGFLKKEMVLGTGLKNVENRIKSIQGTFTFESNPNKGLQITFKIPT
ncbi:tetratricopeptide repeat-containing sensor histidine kinase [Aquimarina agarilytica]|uniref:tetratricopeptide repeat-containing sensor histidine kinase n=1 Tax=Aquimarina agarilytica TaxID=1087449 RepID=UPI000287A4D8|nr:tetratricopeptide repeat-containing sensor histidine kinase [Aquimarina agarilytica]